MLLEHPLLSCDGKHLRKNKEDCSTCYLTFFSPKHEKCFRWLFFRSLIEKHFYGRPFNTIFLKQIWMCTFFDWKVSSAVRCVFSWNRFWKKFWLEFLWGSKKAGPVTSFSCVLLRKKFWCFRFRWHNLIQWLAKIFIYYGYEQKLKLLCVNKWNTLWLESKYFRSIINKQTYESCKRLKAFHNVSFRSKIKEDKL